MKQPKPWFRASKNAWYVEHHFKQVRLGDHPANAPTPKKTKSGWNVPQPIQDVFYRLMAADPANLPKPDSLTVAVLCDLFLEQSKKHNTADTYENYRHFLQSFCDAHGRTLAAEIKPFHVNSWIDSNATWKGARRHATIAVKRLFSWADQQGILSPSPVRTMKAERVNRRTRVLTSAEQGEILAAIRDEPFRQFVRAMFATGCRPSEVARVTAANVNFELGVWAFEQHKTAKKTARVFEVRQAIAGDETLIRPHSPSLLSKVQNKCSTTIDIQVPTGCLAFDATVRLSIGHKLAG